MEEDSREQINRVHLTGAANDLDVFTDAERLGHNDNQTRHEVAQHSLHRQARAHASNRHQGDQRSDRNSQGAESHHHEERHDDEPRHAGEQHSHGRFEVAAFKRLAEKTAQ